jgi:hypothetical protein
VTADPWLLPLADAAAACYADGGVPWFQNPAKTCHVFKSIVAGHPCYAFEGTSSFREWMIDFLALEVPWFAHPEAGPVHLGFWLDIQDAVAAIAADLTGIGWPSYLVTGHSKGAGESVLACLQLSMLGHPPLATRSYEPPTVGTDLLTRCLARRKVDIGWTKTWNTTGVDIVTQVPDWPEWVHQGVETRLQVPDAYGIAEKHQMPAVLAAVQALAGVGVDVP